ncbi:MAG: DUF4320 family protein [Paenibacillus macerans]|uniref:DUF4320 family protein n=1 Tax=Paenibacillus TaxID=44249 RepID=UPI00290B9D8E|nr:DUF4320 family protein [Paenibacillus macerans]MDU7472169.1 DUF4320 family protein [Paenibacillus macerans]MEC0331985.1 DUF4320 family protein [Paenibacillus macerans]
MKRVIASRRGEGYVDVVVIVLVALLCIALAIKVFPVFITQQQLNTFADELAREAETTGRIGPETSQRIKELQEQTGLHPAIEWSKTGRIQINEEVTVILRTNVNIGLFGNFGSFPIELSATATGKSEVYWK